MTKETPPGSGNYVEEFEGTEVHPEATKEALTNDLIEKALQSGSELNTEKKYEIEKRAKELSDNIKNSNKFEKEIEAVQAKKPKGDEVWSVPVPTEKPRPRSYARNAFMAAKVGLWSLLGITATNKLKAATFEDSTKNNIENINTTQKDSLSKLEKKTVKIYKGGKTKEGSITPTGFDNSFYNNEYGVTEADLPILTTTYNFSSENFQTDMVEYVQKNKPEIIKNVLEKFGPTNYSIEKNIPGYKGLEDGNFGLRMAYIVNELKKEIENQKKAQNISIETRVEKSKEKTFDLDGYNRLVILFDASPSMNKNSHKEILASDLKDNKSDIPVEIVTFTDKIESQTTDSSLSSAVETLKNIKTINEDRELGLSVLKEKLGSMEKIEGNSLIVLCTDEELQGVSEELLSSIKEISIKKGLEIEFSIMIEGNKVKISLDQLIKIYENNYKASVESKILEDKKAIEIRKKIIADPSTDKKEIANSTQEIKSFEEAIKRHSMVNISNFRTMENDIAKK